MADNITLNKITETLSAEKLTPGFSAVLESSTGVIKPEEQTELLAWIEKIRLDYLEVAHEVEDEEDRAMTLAIRYIELKSRWILFNTLLNYQMHRRGDSDRVTMYRAALLSHTLGMIEPMLNPPDIAKITDFLSKPIHSLT